MLINIYLTIIKQFQSNNFSFAFLLKLCVNKKMKNINIYIYCDIKYIFIKKHKNNTNIINNLIF
jgi:hypothetical protein